MRIRIGVYTSIVVVVVAVDQQTSFAQMVELLSGERGNRAATDRAVTDKAVPGGTNDSVATGGTATDRDGWGNEQGD